MGCGCKKKKINPAKRPKTVNKVVIVEGEVKVTKTVPPPEVLKPPPPPAPESNIEHIVDKLNNILKPH